MGETLAWYNSPKSVNDTVFELRTQRGINEVPAALKETLATEVGLALRT